MLKFFKRLEKTSRQSHPEPSSDNNKMMENLKNTLVEMWVLSFLNCRIMTVLEMIEILEQKSDATFKIAYPIGVIYRLTNSNYIRETPRNTKCRYWEITSEGREYLFHLRQIYELFIQKNTVVLQSIENGQDRFQK